MNRKDKHINKYLHDRLPDPEIPADEAWASMDDMLTTTAGDGAGSHGANGQGSFSSMWKAISKFKGLLIGASAVITSVAVVWIVLKNEVKNQKYTENRPVDANTHAPAPEETSVKTNALEPAAKPGGVTEASPSEKPSSGIPTSEIAPSRTLPAETALPEPTRPTPAGAARSVAPTNPVVPGGSARYVLRKNHPAPPANRLNLGQIERGTRAAFGVEENTNAKPGSMPINTLKPLSGRFKGRDSDLTKLVKTPTPPNGPQPAAKNRIPIWRDVHFGPEWNFNRSFASTDYMFTGADSIKRPLRLAVPGVFVSKAWNRHTATFIFNPMHAYFGDKEVVAQRVDTLRITDSTFNRVYRNTHFIKALGINFSLQYQFRATHWLSLAAGLSYARYSSALLRKETEFLGNVFPESHLTVRGREVLQSYIRPQQWNIRAGVLFHSPGILNNRLQVAWMTTIPISNLSLEGFKSTKSPNVQFSLRFLIK